VVGLLNEKVLGEADVLWAEARNPQAARQLRETTTARDALSGSFDQTRAAIEQLGGLSDDDPRSPYGAKRYTA
jgi:hypothetical protein